MSSQVEIIRTQLDQLVTNANTVADSLDNFSQRFTENISLVLQTIGGTSTDAEREIVAALEEASKQVTNAIGALAQVAQKAQDYAKLL
jgi:ABC-type transporter Mla subunit MlaD